MKIQILHKITGRVLFELDKDENSVRLTLEAAAKSDANLCGANLCGANLCGASLCDANLCGANLCGANLCGANLCGASLCDANLCDADLCGAILCGASLCGANLCDASLRGANLRGANLCGASLCGANLCDASLRGANLCGANLRGAKNIPYIPLYCPSDGAFAGWKKVNNYLIELNIPSDARRSSATTKKCRCDKARVVSIQSIKDGSMITEIENTKYAPLTYKVGEWVYPDSYDENRWNECSNGIHFFINKQDALDY